MFDEIYDFQINAAKQVKDVIDYRILDKKEKILSCIEKGLFLKQFPKSVILYGAGSLAKALIPKIKDTTQIDFIIDNNVEKSLLLQCFSVLKKLRENCQISLIQ